MHSFMGTTAILLIAMLVIFTLPYLIWRVGKTDYWAPLAVVQIICATRAWTTSRSRACWR